MSRLLVYLKPFRGFVALVLVLVFLQSLSELILPTLMADIVNIGIQTGDTPYILKMGGWMLLVAALGALCTIIASYYSAKAATGFGRDLRSQLFARVSGFSQQEFDKLGTASLITRTTNDITQVQQVLIMMMRMMVVAPMMAVGGVIMALWKDATLALVIIGIMPILGLTIFLIARRGVPLFKAIQTKLDKLNLVQREGLTGIRVIRAFNRTDREKSRFQAANWDLTETGLKVNRIMALMMPAMMLILNFSSIAIIWFGGIRIDRGDMQVGDLMAFLQYAMMILFSLIMLSFIFVMLPRAAASAARIQEVLELTGSIHDADRPKPAERDGTIMFRDVTFRYPGAEQPALQHISFEARPGEITAIIGGTGSGKSTLISLIPRFYDVESGSVLVGGIDVREMAQMSLREKIGFVPQKAVLFSGTIAENIRYGKEDANDEEVRQAAEKAQALDFIMEMDGGFDARISQGGSNVSGGQRQRLSIARALVRRPDIYVFDDCFSALDYKTDAKLRQALQAETQDATVIIVAQRFSTVIDADRIVVLEGGRIAGIGTHQQLMRDNTVYQEIVASQLSEEEIA